MSEPGRSPSDRPDWGALAGRLRLHPGRSPAVTCERPMVRAALMQRLAEGRMAQHIPDVLSSVFSLGAAVQRDTARRAVHAAFGAGAGMPAPHEAQAQAQAQALALALLTGTEHLHRFALDLPVACGEPFPVSSWLAAVPRPVSMAHGYRAHELGEAAPAFAHFVAHHVLGMNPAQWLANWQSDQAEWLNRWVSTQTQAATQPLPIARWLAAVQSRAKAVRWPCRALAVLEAGEAGWRALAAALAEVPDFAELPLWQGAPAETGPWTRLGHPDPVGDAWDRLGARLADVARIALGAVPACGALSVAPGEGIAWTEMSRGLLVHWVRLVPGTADPERARVDRYRILAPTEWNFHPQGGLGRVLASASPAAPVRVAAAALDPCVSFTLGTEKPVTEGAYA